MKKPAGVTKEQWAKYKQAIDLAVEVASKSLDLIAEANFQAGQISERYRIIKLLEGNSNHYGCAWDCVQGCGAPTFVELIALIKGERSE